MRALTVVVPCYNEADGIPKLKRELEPVLEKLKEGRTVELIVVDDGSTDDTHRLLKAAFPKDRVVRHKSNLNLGAAIATGFRESRGEIVAFLDSDCTYSPCLLLPLVQAIDEGAHIATVSPYHPLGKVIGVPWWRIALSKNLSRVYRALLRRRIYTYTALPRAYLKSVHPEIDSPAADFTWLAVAMIRAIKKGLEIVEIPAPLSVREFGQSKMKTVGVIRAHLKILVRLCSQPRAFAT